MTLRHSSLAPGAAVPDPGQAITLRSDENTLLLENATITSSDGSPTGTRFARAINMGNRQPNTSVTVHNSTFEYTENTAGAPVGIYVDDNR